MIKSSSTPNEPTPISSNRGVYLMAGAIVLLGIAAYHNSLSVPFLFDDLPNIEKNASLRRLFSPAVLMPPAGAAGTVGRPLINLSLALNYALGGVNVGGYHAFNLVVHLLAGLTLFGAVRRTLALPRFVGAASRVSDSPARSETATWLAGAVAALWVVHPLQTESVVSTIQRTELLVGLFYLLTFYCFLRSVAPAASGWWQAATVACGFLGVACKEVMATAPLLIFLYDGIFVATSFRAAWAARGRLYLGLMASWILLAFLMLGSGQRSGTVGFGLGMSSWDYLLTQCHAITLYLKLVFWPHPLVLDYGYGVVSGAGAVVFKGLLLVGLALATIWTAWRRLPIGFAGAWFFIILAPSSSFVPLTTQTIAEHRMYLPLVAIVAPVAIALYRWMGPRALWMIGATAVVLVAVTVQRNDDYRTGLSIWADTATKAPANARAQTNWGNALARAGRRREAIPHYQEAIRLDPHYPEAHYDLGLALLQEQKPGESIPHFNDDLRLRPADPEGHRGLGNALALVGRMPEALEHYQKAAALEPEHAEGLGFLGWALLLSNRAAEAIPHLEKAIQLSPDSVNIRVDLANALMQTGRPAAALPHYEAAARLKPDAAEIHYNWGMALMQTGRHAEAVTHFETVVRLKPDDAEARNLLARTRRDAGRSP